MAPHAGSVYFGGFTLPCFCFSFGLLFCSPIFWLLLDHHACATSWINPLSSTLLWLLQGNVFGGFISITMPIASHLHFFFASLIIYIPKLRIFIRMSTSILNALVQIRDRCLFMSVPLHALCLLDTFYSIQGSKDGACPLVSLPPPLVLKFFPSSSVKLLYLPRLSASCRTS